MVASKCYEVPPPAEMANDAAVNNALMQADAVRMIGIRKKAGEPLVSKQFFREQESKSNLFVFSPLRASPFASRKMNSS